MIGFQDQRPAFLQVISDKFGGGPGVRAISQAVFAVADHEPNRIRCIMGNRKGMDLQTIKDKGLTGFKFTPHRQGADSVLSGSMGGDIGIYRQVQPSGEHTDSFNVVIVFVGDEQGGEHLRSDPQPGQPPDNLLAGKTIVDEQAG